MVHRTRHRPTSSRFAAMVVHQSFHGSDLIVQAPNLALVVFALAWAAGRLLDSHHAATRILSDVASGAIVFWSLDELLRGVNPWRRALGAAVLAASLVSLWPR